MQRDLKVFRERGDLPSQRSDRKGNCLSASARVLPLQRSKTMHGRKRFMSANEANFQSSQFVSHDVKQEDRHDWIRLMKNNPLPRLDTNPAIRRALLPFCRLKAGEVWEDSLTGHKVACLDAAFADQVTYLMGREKATIAIHDPPYNLVAFDELPLRRFIDWCEKWVRNTERVLSADSSLMFGLALTRRTVFNLCPIS